MKTKRQAELSKTMGMLVPMIPFDEGNEVKALASQRHLRHLPVSISLWLSLVAHIRHVHTDYDALLDEGYDRDAARHFVMDEINDVLSRWQSTRLLDGSETETASTLPDPVEDQE